MNRTMHGHASVPARDYGKRPYATDGMWMARTQTDFEMKAHLKPKVSLICRFFLNQNKWQNRSPGYEAL